MCGCSLSVCREVYDLDQSDSFNTTKREHQSTLRLLARERELAKARRRIEERGQQVGPRFGGIEGEVEVEMAGNQHRGANPLQNHNEEARAEEEPRTMGYYMTPQAVDIQSPILNPPVAANNFEIKLALVTIIQNNALFHGELDMTSNV
ncbi:unnamed protein product [Linum trigynum]|uniref:Uncharacterized protein n=1 Tax=Linum trigynum TaxID=586398 RepID=A0AAV2DEI3_9ROSI